MTEKEIGWVVGFLEGEGSFQAKGNVIRVSVSQVQLEPLERLRRYIGGHIYRVRAKKGPIHHWTLNGKAAALMMEFLLPDLSPRRQEQCRKALTTYGSRPKRDWHAWSRAGVRARLEKKRSVDGRQIVLLSERVRL